eukprot:272185_1
MQNVLVLIIGITNFDNSSLNLPNDVNNIMKLIQLWRNTYNYTVRLCNGAALSTDKKLIGGDEKANEEDKRRTENVKRYGKVDKEDKKKEEKGLYCSKQDVINFIDRFKENVSDFEAVIVHVFSHGQNGKAFQTSDDKLVRLGFITHELTEASDSSHMKLIFYHACRGDADYHCRNEKDMTELQTIYDEKRCAIHCCCKSIRNDRRPITQNGNVEIVNMNDDNMKSPLLRNRSGTNLAAGDDDDANESPKEVNCVTIFGNIEDRTQLTKGYFTQCICDVFGNNAKKIVKKNFVELLIGEGGLGQRLSKITKGGAICSSESTLTFGKPIRFIPSNTMHDIILDSDEFS